MVKNIQENNKTENISIDENAMLAQAKAGNLDAIERLIIRYQQRIYNTVLKMCANKEDAAELTQETFIKVIQNIKSFKAKSCFYTWMFRIAVNLTINFCKKNAKINFRSLEMQTDENLKNQLKDFLIDKKSPNPPVNAANNELHEIITAAIDKLDEDQKTVVVLKDIEHMNYAQIAETLEIELGTVKSRLSRGRKNLREFLEAAL